MGKVLVHKLLYSCPGVGQIYLLIRPKRGVEVKDRLSSLLAADPFKDLSEKQLSKVEAVEGDITLPRLGLSEIDESKLQENVSVIFHSAATVKFDEDLTK